MPDLSARRGALVGVLIVALTIALLADLMTPYGPVALTLGAAFLGLTVVAGLLSIPAPLRDVFLPAATVAGVHAIVFAALIGLWFAAPQPAAHERGVIVAFAPALKPMQESLVNVAPHAAFLQDKE